LLKIATEMADTPQAIENARCLSAKQIRIYGKSLVKGRAKGQRPGHKDLPVYPRRRRPSVSPRVPDRIKSHQGLAGQSGRSSGVGSRPAVQQGIDDRHCHHKPSDIDGLRRVEGIHNWQVEAFGKDILSVLSGQP
jgi:ribonuclease D